MATPTVTPQEPTETTTPEPIPVPEGFQSYEQRPDGTFYAKLGDGTEFSGTSERELIARIGKAKVDTANWAKSIQQRAEQVITPTPAVSEEETRERELQKYLLDQNAKALGFPSGEEYAKVAQKLVQTSNDYEARQQQVEFRALCPDFPNTTEASQKLVDILASEIGWDGKTIPTAKQYRLAHIFAINSGAYKPMTQEEMNASRGNPPAVSPAPNAPPMLPGTQPEQRIAQNVWDMPIKDLEKQINQGLSRVGGLANALKEG